MLGVSKIKIYLEFICISVWMLQIIIMMPIQTTVKLNMLNISTTLFVLKLILLNTETVCMIGALKSVDNQNVPMLLSILNTLGEVPLLKLMILML
jgi:hypothetical protein